MGVTATVVGTLNLTFVTDAAGMPVVGTGTAVASMPFGNVQMFGGTPPVNVTRTVNGTTLSRCRLRSTYGRIFRTLPARIILWWRR